MQRWWLSVTLPNNWDGMTENVTKGEWIFPYNMPFIVFCKEFKYVAACPPSICTWWNWKEMGNLVFIHPLRYLPHITIGLQNLSVYYWFMMQSSSVSIIGIFAEINPQLHSLPWSGCFSRILSLFQSYTELPYNLRCTGVQPRSYECTTFDVQAYNVGCTVSNHRTETTWP